MRLMILALALMVFSPAAQSQKKKSDVQVLECKPRRSEDKIVTDVRLRVTSEKTLKGLVLVFHFLDSGGNPIVDAKTSVSDDSLDPGEEPSVRASAPSPPGAIKCKLQAFDGDERELRIVNPGPFTIE